MVEEGKYKWDRDSKLTKHMDDCLLCDTCVSHLLPGMHDAAWLQHLQQGTGHTVDTSSAPAGESFKKSYG